MSDLREDWQRYKNTQQQWHDAAESVRLEVIRIAKEAGIPADVTAREKDLAEFARKAIRKRYTNPWEQITDKAGARAVVERDSHVDALLAAILDDASLTVVDGTVKDLRKLDPERLEYSGVHCDVIAPAASGATETYSVELQLRTKAQDLWSSVVSHRLLYKKDLGLPSTAKRCLLRLVALMEIFDEEVDRVAKELPALRGYNIERLTSAAESIYLSVRPLQTWDRSISADLVHIVLKAKSDEDVDTYIGAVQSFAEAHRSDLEGVLEDYGPRDDEVDPYYVLFDQPEIVLLWERIVCAPERLRNAWQDSTLPMQLIETVANVFGKPLP